MRSDLDLRNDVLAELQWEPSIRASEIGVTAKDGVITLSGSVDSYPAKMEAEKAALRVSGVKAVANDIHIVLPGERQRTDEDIALSASNVLNWDVILPPGHNIQVTVDHGWVTMTGEVEWQYQKTAAGDAVHRLTGVKGITNNLTVTPRVVPPSAVKEKIVAAIQRNASLDANGIRVGTQEGKVTLEGTVRSWIEKEQAEQAAWAAPGVTQVKNLLAIGTF